MQRGPSVKLFDEWIAKLLADGWTLMRIGTSIGINTSQISRFRTGKRLPTAEQRKNIDAASGGVVGRDGWTVVAYITEPIANVG